MEGGSLGAASSLMSAALSYYEAASLLDDEDVKLMVGCCHSYLAAAARLAAFLCAEFGCCSAPCHCLHVDRFAAVLSRTHAS